MEYNLTPDQQLFRDTTRDFLEKETPLTRCGSWPSARSASTATGGAAGPSWAGRRCSSPGAGGDSISGEGLRGHWRSWPRRWAGSSRRGRWSPVNVVAAALVEAADTPTQHAELVEALMAGEAVASWAVHEPGRGWEPAGTALAAAPDGDGYVLTGVKDRVESGDQAD